VIFKAVSDGFGIFSTIKPRLSEKLGTVVEQVMTYPHSQAFCESCSFFPCCCQCYSTHS